MVAGQGASGEGGWKKHHTRQTGERVGDVTRSGTGDHRVDCYGYVGRWVVSDWLVAATGKVGMGLHSSRRHPLGSGELKPKKVFRQLLSDVVELLMLNGGEGQVAEECAHQSPLQWVWHTVHNTKTVVGTTPSTFKIWI